VAGEAPAATAVSKVRSGRLAMAHRCPAPQPALKRGEIGSAREHSTPPPRCLPVAICRDATGAVEQGEVGLLFRQNRQEIAKRSKDRQAYAPTVAVLDPEQRDLPHDIRRRYAGRKLAVDRFGNDKAQEMPEAVVEPLAPMRCRIGVTESRPHPGLAVTQLGVGTSSAHRSKLQPLARSKRAWCQWQVRIPSSTLPRSSGKPI
jgi:hypothetical protein